MAIFEHTAFCPGQVNHTVGVPSIEDTSLDLQIDTATVAPSTTQTLIFRVLPRLKILDESADLDASSVYGFYQAVGSDSEDRHSLLKILVCEKLFLTTNTLAVVHRTARSSAAHKVRGVASWDSCVRA